MDLGRMGGEDKKKKKGGKEDSVESTLGGYQRLEVLSICQRTRKENWSGREKKALVDAYIERRMILDPKLSSFSGVTREMKLVVWEEVKEKVNTQSNIHRTLTEVRKKMMDLKYIVRLRARQQRGAMYQTGVKLIDDVVDVAKVTPLDTEADAMTAQNICSMIGPAVDELKNACDRANPENASNRTNPENGSERANPENASERANPEIASKRANPENASERANPEDASERANPENASERANPENASERANAESASERANTENASERANTENASCKIFSSEGQRQIEDTISVLQEQTQVLREIREAQLRTNEMLRQKDSVYFSLLREQTTVLREIRDVQLRTNEMLASNKRKRAPTAYMMWCSANRAKLVSENPGIDFSTISKTLGEMWSNVSEKEKIVWKRKAKKVGGKGSTLITTGPKYIPRTITTARQQAVLSQKSTPTLAQALLTTKQAKPPSIDDLASPIKGFGMEPVDVAAHLKIVGESLSIIGMKLQEHRGLIAVQGSLSVLLDSMLCAMAPLMCLTAVLPETNGLPAETHLSNLDNIAYIMPGL